MFRFLVLSILILTATISFGHKCYDEADPDCENESDIKCVNCECINCKNEENNCVSGDMQVVEQTKGIVRVSQLSEDDVIIGIMGAEQTSTWCKVTAIFPAAHGQNRITHDGFTPGHMVLNSSVHVQPYGHKGEVAAIFSTASSFSHTFSGILTISIEFFLEFCSSMSILSYNSSISSSCSFTRFLVACSSLLSWLNVARECGFQRIFGIFQFSFLNLEGEF